MQYIEEGSEPKEFWVNWGFLDSEPQIKSRMIKEWDNWYLSLQPPILLDPIQPDARNIEDELDVKDAEDIKSELETLNSNKPLLFLYPNCNDPLGIFDFEDLSDDSLCVLCKNEEFVKKVFIWKGGEWIGDGKDEENFVGDVIRGLWGDIGIEEVVLIKEMANNESEEFMDCFQ